jgi:hypothetical protein
MGAPAMTDPSSPRWATLPAKRDRNSSDIV